MLDDILVNVPRMVEDEPGFAQQLLLNSRDQRLDLSTAAVPNSPEQPAAGDAVEEVTAYLDPVSRRWMGKPYLVPALATPAHDWETDLALSAMTLAAAGGDGVEVTESRSLAADPPAPWRMTTGVTLGAGRGFVVALHPYEPDDWADSLAPLRLQLGDSWRITLTPTESGAATALVAEADGTTPGAFEAGMPVVLTRGDWYNATHRLWCQPLDDTQWLVRNFDDEELGAVVTARRPTAYQPTQTEAGLDDDGSGQQPAPPKVRLPWGDVALSVEGFTRVWVVVSHVVFAATWWLASAEATGLGYLTGVAPTVEAGFHLPPVGLANGAYAVTTAVWHGGSRPAAFGPETPGDRFDWRMTAQGPTDQRLPTGDAGRACSHRCVTVDKLRLQWPLTVGSDGLLAVSLRSEPRVGVQSLLESRPMEDSAAALTVEIDGPRALVAPWLMPNARWQWVLADERAAAAAGEAPEPLVRFDGLRDAVSSRVYRALDGVYYTRATVRLRNRWRQLDYAMWRGNVPLDGMKRSAIYQALAERAPLDPETEIAVSTSLISDVPLPTTRPGDAPSFAPQPGTSLGYVVRTLRDGLGYWDRVRFVGTRFVVTPRSDLPVAVFYRHPRDVPGRPQGAKATGEPLSWGDWRDLPAIVIGGPGADPVFTELSDDLMFINDLWVIGRDPDSPRARPTPIVACMMDPRSWQDASSELYVAQRRTAVVQRPELTSQAAVDAWCRCLWRRFHRFVYQAALQATFAPFVYPGDLALLHPGSDPAADLCLVEIVGMQTALTAGDRAVSGSETGMHYLTTYEVQLAPAVGRLAS